MTDPRPASPGDRRPPPEAIGDPAPDGLADQLDLASLIPDNLADLAAGESPTTVGPVDKDPDGPAEAAPARSTPTVWQQMGGPMGMVDSGLPVVVFVIVNVVAGLGWAIGAALAAGVIIAIMRLVRRRPVTQAIGGLFAVGVAAFIAYRTGSAKGYFLLGIWLYLLYGGVLLLSMIVRWPLIGVLWEALNGRGTTWRADKKLVRRYDWATAVWVVIFAARYLVQNYLYDTDQVGWLAAVRLLMGYPVYLTGIAISVLIVIGPEVWRGHSTMSERISAIRRSVGNGSGQQ